MQQLALWQKKEVLRIKEGAQWRQLYLVAQKGIATKEDFLDMIEWVCQTAMTNHPKMISCMKQDWKLVNAPNNG